MVGADTGEVAGGVLHFTPEIIDEVFPFHVAFGSDLRVVKLGRVLERLLGGEAVGRPFRDLFRIATPSLPAEFQAIRGQAFSVFFVQLLQPEITLRGQMLFSDTAFPDHAFFLCSPVVQDLEAVARLGLTLKDFAVHDSAMDFLILLQTQNNSLKDLARMAQRLRLEVAVRRNAEFALREANEELENRVHERTCELQAANAGLALEIDERARVGAELAQVNAELEERVRARTAELARATRNLSDQLHFMRQLIDSIPSPVFYKDVDGRFLGCNRAFAAHHGRAPEELLGRTDGELWPGEVAAYQEARDRELLTEHPGMQTFEGTSLSADGTERAMVFYRATFSRSNGSLGGLVGVMLDISERKHMESRLEHQAHHDLLTDLPNRLLFEDRLLSALRHARRDGYPLAVLFIDIDNFKTINDTLGHPVGDRVLQEFAQRLRSLLRQSDTVARLGGDEFILLLDRVDGDTDVLRVAKKLFDHLRTPIRIEGQAFYVTVSIGASVHPRDGSDVASLVKNADIAMYRAKQKGANSFEFYRHEINPFALERFSLEADLRRALERRELVLHYQPLFSCREGHLIGAEALARWEHPQHGLIPPVRFIPLAEETGLISALGEWALRTACAQLVDWDRRGLTLPRVAVNLSGIQMRQTDVSKTVQEILAETGLPASRLELEVTEGTMMHHAEEGLLEHLRALGVRLSVDDFGTGYSSLAYLKRLPLAKLKIDRSFVLTLPERNDAAIVRAIIALGKSLGLAVCAEGVETSRQRDFLEAEGCDELQGYLLGRPMSGEVFFRQFGPVAVD